MRRKGMTNDEMPNDEVLMTKECRSPNDEDSLHTIRVSSLVIDSSFVLSH